MPDKAAAIDALEQEYVTFRELIVDLPDAAYREVMLGVWDLEHVLAHMAGWYREMSGAFERVARGERPVPEGVDYSNADAWNEKFAANPKHGPAALDDFDMAFHQYDAAAQSLAEELYGDDPASGRPRIGNRLLQAAGIGHLQEHRPEVEAWLAARA
ncbi:MAG TPA: maleylpyruvate isomerase N-terminal domain-containing protein [Tepidiformaceae bacterium]